MSGVRGRSPWRRRRGNHATPAGGGQASPPHRALDLRPARTTLLSALPAPRPSRGDTGARGPPLRSAYVRHDRAAPGAADLALGLAVALLATALLLPGVPWGLPSSKATVGALRILDGDLPYRDFWTMYAPGQFYLVAGLFLAFGEKAIVAAIATVVLRGLSAGVFYRLLRGVGAGRLLAALLGLGVALMFLEAGPQMDSYAPALLLVLVAFERLVAYFRAGGPGRLLAAGFALGGAALFKHDVAAYAGVAFSAALVLAWPSVRERPDRWLSPPAALLRLGAACALVVVPVAAWLATVAGPDAWYDLLEFPATDFRAVRGESYPPLLPSTGALEAWFADPGDLRLARKALRSVGGWLKCRLPELVFALGALWLLLRSRRAQPAAAGALLVALLALPLFWYAAHVQRNTHLYSMAILCAVVFAVVVATERSGAVAVLARLLAAPIVLAFAVGFGVPAAESAFPVVDAWRRLGPPGGERLPYPIAEHLIVSPREAAYFVGVTDFLLRNTEPDERVHVGVARHDAVVIGNQRFYVLSGRRPATRYNELHPGIVDRASVQREMIADLERHDVRCVVLWNFGGDNPDWSGAALDGFVARRVAAVPELGATLLDAYIAERFAVVETHDEYDVLWRRDLPPPEPAR